MNNNKVALVTGASRGIGASTARELAGMGFNIVINYASDETSAKEVEQEINKLCDVQTLVIKADISKEAEVKKMIDKVVLKFGRIDVVVNNAAIAIDTLFMDKTVTNFRRILDVNLIGTFLVSKYAGDFMKKAQSGVIINISSTNGIDTYYPMSLDYDASKAGVISLTHNLALEYAPYIRVNTVAPGWVKTDMNKELDQEFVDKENQKILLERFANPEEIAKVVSFLVSEEASYINDTVIRVDGGLKY
ncbi:MAG: 3-oxoacyl-ACP reductase family protein [Bacilli bacterium]